VKDIVFIVFFFFFALLLLLLLFSAFEKMTKTRNKNGAFTALKSSTESSKEDSK
jgi:cbb3-type cytochrome oxidase subunit 3